MILEANFQHKQFPHSGLPVLKSQQEEHWKN